VNKHILLSTDDPGVGGVSQYNHSLICGLIELGYQVTCLQPQPFNERLITYQKQLGIQHLWLENNAVRELPHTLTTSSKQPDLIICSNSNPFSNFAIKQITIQLGIPYIVVEGLVEPYLADRFADYLNELSHHYAQAKSVIAVSHDNLSLLHKLFKLPKHQGQVIYYGRPSEYFTPHNSSVREYLRQELSIPLDAVVCFTAARIETRKGYQYQLEAIKQLMESTVWPQLYFVWVGAGIFEPQLEAQLREEVEQLKITNKVKFLGQRSDVSNWLNAADIFVFPSQLEGMPLCVMEAMAKGLPVIATAVSGIPEELGDTGKLLPDPKINPQGTISELVTTIQDWIVKPELRHKIGQACKQRAEGMFREERMIKETVEVIERAFLPLGDYVSPGFSIIRPDQAFSNMIVGDTKNCSWPYLRREILHNWYVDKRQPTVGFLSRDEAHILYNTALKFKGKRALEIGCWLGWSACHLALAGVELDVVDPLLGRPEFYESVSSSLRAAGVLDSVNLIPGYSPQKVEELAAQFQHKWSLIFIDGNHDAPGPLNDAIACEQLAEVDALILFHDLASPDVAQGLEYFKRKGWHTMVYQTMQIMGVAWRGNVEPVRHQPDPKVKWCLPEYLQKYSISNLRNKISIKQNTTEKQVYTEDFYELLRESAQCSAKEIIPSSKQQKMPLVSVVIPCYNQAQFLSKAVASVIAQTYDNWEIIIVNDGSPDNTSEVAKQLITVYTQKIRLVEQENGGVASARNAGIAAASGEYILPLDADDKLSSTAIASLLKVSLSRSLPCIAFGSYQMFGADQRTCVSVNFYSTENIKRFNMLAVTCLYPKKVWDLVNGYKADIDGASYEDWDFWLSCHQHKIPFYGTSEIVLYYRKQSSSRLKEARENHEKLYAKLVSSYPELFDSTLIENDQNHFPKIIIDGVFFQLYKTGIARVWKSLLEEWADNGFAKHIVMLDRAGTAPKVPGIRYRSIPLYDHNNISADREMLQQICDEEGANLFISTYYTTPISTPSVLMVHDMIPELAGWDPDHPNWRGKHHAIQYASAYIAVSDNTARDLVKFFPDISTESITVAHNGVNSTFSPASSDEVYHFKARYGISKPYFVLVGTGSGHKDTYKNTVLFFQAFSKLHTRQAFDIVCTGGGLFEDELRAYTSGSAIHMLQLSDEELRAAYSGAIALVYPSKYEGFGLPVLEAIACGCPVITCPNGAIPEVAGEAALYVNDNDVNGLANALCEVQKPDVRNSLIATGLEQAKKFSWSKMAETVSSALIAATLLPFNLKKANFVVFPDWDQPEDLLLQDLASVVRAAVSHPDKSQMAFLIDTGDISQEDANLALSTVVMNLLMEEDLDVTDGPEISLVGRLSEVQWQALLPHIQARIALEHENQRAILHEMLPVGAVFLQDLSGGDRNHASI
jgi:glycosyltransferase involved in cell wall biosynthesis/predicted O-methyltransferase YrrM